MQTKCPAWDHRGVIVLTDNCSGLGDFTRKLEAWVGKVCYEIAPFSRSRYITTQHLCGRETVSDFHIRTVSRLSNHGCRRTTLV
jgi:hypothetical protein